MGWMSRLLGLDGLDRVVEVHTNAQTVDPYQAKGVTFTPELVRTIPWGEWGAWPASYGQLYRKQPAVRAVVDWLGRNIGQLNPKVYERIGDTDRIEVGDHPLALSLRKPNPATSRYRHLRDTVQDFAIYDKAVWSKERVRGGMVTVRIPPHQLVTETDEATGATVYRHAPTGRVYRRNELVIFSGYTPDGDNNPVSPLETLRRVLAEEWAAQVHRENMWRNSARQSGWIERPLEAPDWSDDARRRFRADIEGVMSGASNAGRIGVLEEGMTWNGTSFSPEQTQYLEGRRLTYEEVCVEYGLTPDLLGMGAGTANANITDTRHRQAYQDVLGPWLRMLQDEIELQLLPDLEPFNARSTVYVEFNLAEKLKGSFEEQGKTLVTSTGVPYMTVNEARARLNLPRIDEDWADTPVQPLNVMYGGQPAVTVPTADPSTASFPSIPYLHPAVAKAAAGQPEDKEPAPAPQHTVLARVDEATRNDIAGEVTARLRKFFERQERSVISEWGGTNRRPREKWDDELRADLWLLSDTAVRSVGFLTAGLIHGRYSHGHTRDWVSANADRMTKAVNANTFRDLDEAADLDAVKHVFATAKGARADQLGRSLATVLLNFGRVEAGRHSTDGDGKARTKTWATTSTDSRHADLAGQTVAVDDLFSNGARFPGDPALDADESAGCTCQIELGEAPQ